MCGESILEYISNTAASVNAVLERAGNKKDVATTEGGELKYRTTSANQLSSDLEEKHRNYRKGS